MAYDNPTQQTLMQLYELGIAYGDAGRSADWRSLKLRAHVARIEAMNEGLFRERAELYDDAEYNALTREAAGLDVGRAGPAVPAGISSREEMVALTLANSMLEKFGGDSVSEVRRNIASYLDAIPASQRLTEHLS